MLANIEEKLDQAPPQDPAVLLMTVLTRGYLMVAPHQDIQDFAPGFLQKCDQKLGERVVQAIERGVQQIPLCKTTQAMATLASAMWADIVQAHEEQQEEQHQDQQQDQQPEQDQSQETDSDDEQSEPGQPQSQDQPGEQSGDSEEAADATGDVESESGDGSTNDQTQESNSQQDAADPAQDNSCDAQHSQPGNQAGDPSDASSPTDEDAGQQQTAQQPTSDSGGSQSAGGSEAQDQPTAATDSGLSEPGGEQSGQGGGGGSGSGSGSGSGTTPSKPKPAPLDLSQAADQDLGTLMKQAYEQAFGEPDVDSELPDENASAGEEGLSEAEMQAIAQALEDGSAADMDYEQLAQCTTQAIEAAEQAEIDKQQAEQSTQVAMSSGEAGGHGAGTDSAGPGTPKRLDLDVRLTGLVSRLVRVFLAGLQDKRRRPMRYAVAGGQVAPSRVWRLKALGDTKVFRVRKPMAGIDAAVTILLDRSGSMEEVIVEAASAALACAQALERVSKVKTSIEMFPSDDWGQGTQVLQRFGESARQVAHRCALVSASGGTPLARALTTCVPRLVTQRAEKHMLIVITDGNPDDAYAAMRELDLAQRQGVEVVGIGMGSYCQIQKLIPNCTNIASVEHLPEAIENLLQGHIVTRLAA
jgi:Mg-chelatase subunit ChlD